MRVSLISSATTYPATDALAHLARFLLRRGDHVRLFTAGPASDLPQPLPELISGAGLSGEEWFRLPAFLASDLYVCHYVTSHSFLETMLALERGVVVLWWQPSEWVGAGVSAQGVVPDDLVRLASASDLVVVEDSRAASLLQAAGAAEPHRLHIVPPAVSLATFTPDAPDAALRRELGLAGRRVLLAAQTAGASPQVETLQEVMALIRTQVPEAVLAIAPHPSDTPHSPSARSEDESIRILPPSADLAPYYRLADIFLAQPDDGTDRQRALEAMACGAPVLTIEGNAGPHASATAAPQLAEAALRLLTDDAAYGEAVRRSLDTAARHSLEAFWQAWSAVIAEACGWLPVRLSTEQASAPQPLFPDMPAAKQDPSLAQAADYYPCIDTEQLKAMATVTLRDYEVRSPTPIFGPFIAWVRRNLTSHLRKPYLDPTLDRQEAFNLRAAAALQDLATRLVSHEQETAHKYETLAFEIAQLAAELEAFLVGLPADQMDTDQAQRIADIRSALERIAALLPPAKD
jgi:glycosyltransferase involved in cell wall biosynthesis